MCIIAATGYVAVFSGITPDGRTTYHCRPLICWAPGPDGLVVGQYVGAHGRVALAPNVPNFSRYMTEEEWADFHASQVEESPNPVEPTP
ncbi:DUF6253 family protein [Streptomyces sp. NPDC005402]|uniref:DUF6253 family protein n=1 Tax=Streptomyces sp. NPDC005402 TaxID=3155338 RepID=UPI0033A574E7